MPTEWTPEKSLGGLIVALSYKLTRQGKIDFAANGLSHVSYGRFWVLHALYEVPRNQASLCRRLSKKAPTMMEMLQRLHGAKLIKYKADPNDPRKKEWSLTARGQRDYLAAREIARQLGCRMDEFFASQGMGTDEIQRLKDVLDHLNQQFFSAVDSQDPR